MADPLVVCIRGGIFRMGGQCDLRTGFLNPAQLHAFRTLQVCVVEPLARRHRVSVVVDVVCAAPRAYVRRAIARIFPAASLRVRIRTEHEATQVLSIVSSLRWCDAGDGATTSVLVVRADLHMLRELPPHDPHALLQMPWRIPEEFGDTTRCQNARACDAFFFTNDCTRLADALSEMAFETSLHDVADYVPSVNWFDAASRYDSNTAVQENPYYRIVNRPPSPSLRVLHLVSNAVDPHVVAVLGVLAVVAMLCIRPGWLTVLLAAVWVYRHPTHLFSYLPRLRIRCPSRPSLILLNHTLLNPMNLCDGFFLKDVAEHIKRTSGLSSSVVVHSSQLNAMMGRHVAPDYLTYIIGANRTQQAIDQLRDGRNVFLFLLDPNTAACGGTSPYHILAQTGSPLMLYLLSYEHPNVFATSLNNVPHQTDYDDPLRFTEELARRFATASGDRYTLKDAHQPSE